MEGRMEGQQTLSHRTLSTTAGGSKILIVFDDMIADLLSNKKINPIAAELFVRDRKFNISNAFTTQSYFAVPKILD